MTFLKVDFKLSLERITDCVTFTIEKKPIFLRFLTLLKV